LKYRFFGRDIEPACEICEYRKKPLSGIVIYCKYNGVVDEYFSCKKFKYDPLKRVPKVLPELKKHKKEDFLI